MAEHARYRPQSCRRRLRLVLSLTCWLLLGGVLPGCAPRGQQTADSTFSLRSPNPTYAEGAGPLVLIDRAHHNFHTAEGRYKPFADLLRSDGYIVRSSDSKFDEISLETGQILVISNALSERNARFEDWGLPTYPAFNKAEISAVESWVRRGGSLLLIADHMPMPGAAAGLAAAFGVRFNNGYAVDQNRVGVRPPLLFRPKQSAAPSDGELQHHSITQGRDESERIDLVATFTGQAFQSDSGEPLLVFGPSIISLMPESPAVFSEETPLVSVGGWYQGLAVRHGRGRVAVFGEAAMFTAQVTSGNRTMGMNSPQAPQNAQFLLNVVHWLSGLLGE